MNRIRATVIKVESVEHITIVSFEAWGQPMRMMALDLNFDIGEGSQVVLGIKATNITLAQQLEGLLSVSNRLPAVIDDVRKGRLVSSVNVRLGDDLLECITTCSATESMQLHQGAPVVLLIKASDLSILEVHDV